MRMERRPAPSSRSRTTATSAPTDPDHRHRCYAEVHPAPRAIAHQEAYCLSSAFAVCPTFQDWAQREAARTRGGAGSAVPPPRGGGRDVAGRRAPPRHAGRTAARRRRRCSVTGRTGRRVAGADRRSRTRSAMTARAPLPPRRNPPRRLGGAAAMGHRTGRLSPPRAPAPPARAAAGARSRAGAGSATAAVPRRAAMRAGSPAARPTAWPAANRSSSRRGSRRTTRRAATRRTAVAVVRASPGTRRRARRSRAQAVRPSAHAEPYVPRTVRATIRGQVRYAGARPPSRPPNRDQPRRRPRRGSSRGATRPTPRSRHGRRSPACRDSASWRAALGIAALALFFLPSLLDLFGGIGGRRPGAGSESPAPSAARRVGGARRRPSRLPPRRCVYVVTTGRHHVEVASTFNVTVDEMIAANPDAIKDPDQIPIGDPVIIPVAGS